MIKKQVYAVVRNDGPYDGGIQVLYISLTLLKAMEYLYAMTNKRDTEIWDWELDAELCIGYF